MKKKLIVITGPTACGKTDIAIGLAKKIKGEIISADSMQVYKLMNIGTAKATKEEMEGIPHYLVDALNPDEDFNAMIFQEKAKAAIEHIYEKENLPIVVGGTGFYINALVYDNDFMSTDDENFIRHRLTKEAEVFGHKFLHEKLMQVDPEYGAIVHENNVKRVIRALEYFEQTGEKLSLHNAASKKKESLYDLKLIILNMERSMLYERINQRVDIMMEQGLLHEVETLLQQGYAPNLVSMQGLGYKEMVAHLNGEIRLNEAVELLKKRTRNFAKRQLTWFRNQNKDAFWLDVTKKTKEEALNEIIDYIQ